MAIKDFAIFIITHGKPDNVITYNTLQKTNCSEKIYFVVDNTDTTIQQYIDNFGKDSIFVFDKNHYINSEDYDNGTNTAIYKCAVYARRAVEDIAKFLNLKSFLMMDDDIKTFCLRVPEGNTLRTYTTYDFSAVMNAHVEWLLNGNIACIGFGNPVTYFKGVQSVQTHYDGKRLLPFQVFLRNTGLYNDWSCWYGEDEISGYRNNVTGNIWLTSAYLMECAMPEKSGAMQVTYKENGSYKRAITELRYLPNYLTIKYRTKGLYKGEYRLERKNKWWFPQIISSSYRKEYT